MKFAFEEFHLWYQVALSMVACGKVRPKACVGGEVAHPSVGPLLSSGPSQRLVDGVAVTQKCPPASEESGGQQRVSHSPLCGTGVPF